LSDIVLRGAIMGLIAGLVYFAFAVTLLYSSVKHRREGWLVGFMFAVSLLTLPFWIYGLLWISGVLPD
jgi:hypothetical protein